METLNQCQWIGAEQTGPSYRMLCGCSPVLGKAYCEEHLWRVYQQGTAVNRRKDRRVAAAVWDLESAFNEAVAELESEGEL